MSIEKELLGEYRLVLGLEIHTQPKTEKKMFCSCSADIWESEPNSHTCPTCLGLPGGLPVPNMEAIKKVQLLGCAFGGRISENSKFDRKHYFYPDLAKGYQISQYKEPFCIGGSLVLDSGAVCELERIHLEEDTAKSFHKGGKTLIDFNKSGMPLIELVTTPCFTSVYDAVDFAKKFQNILRYTGISAADMEKGQLRIEPNISLRTSKMEKAQELPKYKVEIKNINSFKFMEKAVLAEIKRQREILESGETPAQENRGYNENTGKTIPQRSKEEAHDYRYFPEPDIPPMTFTKKYIVELHKELPELPHDITKGLVEKDKVKLSIAKVLVEVLGQDYVEKYRALVAQGLEGATVASYIVNKKEYQDASIAEFVDMLKKSTEKSDLDLDPIINKVVNANAKAVTDYKNGKDASIQFLLGMIMRETRGKANPEKARELLLEALKS